MTAHPRNVGLRQRLNGNTKWLVGAVIAAVGLATTLGVETRCSDYQTRAEAAAVQTAADKEHTAIEDRARSARALIEKDVSHMRDGIDSIQESLKDLHDKIDKYQPRRRR